MKGSERSTNADVSRYLGVGLTWALSTLLFLWLGTVVDRWVGSRPLFTVVGAFVGAGAGFYWMIHHLVIEPGRRAARGKPGGEEQEGTDRQ